MVIGIDDEGNEITEQLDADSDRFSFYESWIQEWNRWAKVTSPKKKFNKCTWSFLHYTNVFSVKEKI